MELPEVGQERNQKKIIAYDFYRRERNEEDKFIGSLRERREKPERITHASIMNWAKLLAPEDVFEDRVYFVQVEIYRSLESPEIK